MDLSNLIRREVAVHYAIDPDPVEWAWYLMALLCCGEKAAAVARASQFPTLKHLELSRARTVLALLDEKQGGKLAEPVATASDRPSVHQLPPCSFDDWLGELSRMLSACGQRALASRLSAARANVTRAVTTVPAVNAPDPAGWRVEDAEQQPLATRLLTKFDNLQAGAVRRLHRMSGKVGYRQADSELLNDMEALAADEAIESAVLIAPGRESRLLDALTNNLQRNTSAPRIVRLAGSSLTRQLMLEAAIPVPSLVCIDSGEADVIVESSVLREAQIVVLTGLQREHTSTLLAQLLGEPDILLSILEPSLWNGFAVLRRLPAAAPTRESAMPTAPIHSAGTAECAL